MGKEQEKAFWIINISDRDVSLSDLNITVRSLNSVNLLDRKHYPHLNSEIIEKSALSGSLFKKSNKIVKRVVPPMANKPSHLLIEPDAVLPSKPRSIVEIKVENYKELDLTDEEFESEMKEPEEPKGK